MTTTQDRVRAAMDAIAGQVDTAPPRPLSLPPPATRRQGWRAPRRWGAWLAPAAAAAAVIAVAVTLVAVRHAPAGRSAPPPPAASPSGVPEYYVALSPVPTLGFYGTAADAVVGDTFTGKRVATVPAPSGMGFASVTATGDDQAFVLAVQPRSTSHRLVPTRWYLLHLSPGAAHPVTLRQLPVPTQSVLQSEFSMALSPDGTMLAIATSPTASETDLRVYSTATGALLHTWSATSGLRLVSWSSGGQLTFQTTRNSSGSVPVVVRQLPADDPGHDLLSDSRPVLSFMTSLSSPHSCIDGFLVAGNGKTVVCGSVAQVRGSASYAGSKACLPDTHPYDTAILQLSIVAGNLTGTLYQFGISCQMVGDLSMFWVNGAGTVVLGYFEHYEAPKPGSQPKAPLKGIGQFGLFTGGKFTPLPSPLASDGSGGFVSSPIAW